MNQTHEKYMRLCMRLAKTASGLTLPNPMVGALVVKNGKIIGTGKHRRCGEEHAETAALWKAGKAALGSTLYVTLEPCAHFGRTPPCVENIIRHGVREVIIGHIDPNPLNNGRGADILRSHGIKVQVGVLEKELKVMNEVFLKYITRKMPFVTVKVGQSLDGKIATRSGDSKWITSDAARNFARKQRNFFDAIMVGVNTVREDDPKLDPYPLRRKLAKIVVDSNLSTPVNARIFAGGGKVIVVTLPSGSGQVTENRALLGAKGRILEVREKEGQINLRDMMRKLAQSEISSILVEGGGTLIGSLFDEKLVDKVMFYISPKIIGGKDAISSVMGKGASLVQRAWNLRDVKIRRIGTDFLVEGYILEHV